MNVMQKLAAATAAAAVATGGALAAVDAAAASSTSHTIKLTAVALKTVQTGNSFMQAEKDLQNGKLTGFDTVSCVFSIKTHKSTCDASVARADGLIHAHVIVGQTGRGTGTVTGGTRAYKGATGTVTTAPGAARNQTKITITYHR